MYYPFAAEIVASGITAQEVAYNHVSIRREHDGSERSGYEDNPAGIVDFSQPLPAVVDRWYTASVQSISTHAKSHPDDFKLLRCD